MKLQAFSLAAVALLSLLAPQANAATGCKAYYSVVSGDYCERIASKAKETTAKLTADNPGVSCDNLSVGDVLCIGYGQGTLPRLRIPDQKCSVKGTFAFTFDDGPFEYTKALLDFLKANNYKATFFLNGNNYGNIYNYSSIVKRIYKDGHQLGHHTWSHQDITALSEKQLRLEITKLETAFRKIIGKVPRIFRPPYGNTDLKSLKVLNELGYRVIKWDVSNDDTVDLENGLKTLKQDKAAFESTLADAGTNPSKGGHIALEHDTQRITVKDFNPWAYNRVKKLGYKIMTVGECLGVKPSEWYKN
jgi:peptidoglycan/xylan/chitin deacetylase (PgdA/CDA1 family)